MTTSAIIQLFSCFKYTPLLCYFFRGCRFFYAFDKQWKIFFPNHILGSILLISISFLIGYVDIQTKFNKTIFFQSTEDANTILKILFVYLSQLILILSIYFVRKVNFYQQYDYWIAFFMELLQFGIKSYLKQITGFEDCNQDHMIPLYYYIDCLKLCIILLISIIIPLFFNHKTISDLPTELQCSNFNFFLAEPLFIDLFYHFLQYQDKNNEFINIINNNQNSNAKFEEVQFSSQRMINNQYTTIYEQEKELRKEKKMCLTQLYLLFLQLDQIYQDQTQNEEIILQNLTQILQEEYYLIQVENILPFKILNKLKKSLNLNINEDVNNSQTSQMNSQHSQSSDQSNDRRKIIIIDIGWNLREIIKQYLREIYEFQYKKTKSYQILYQQCQKNRQITIRLATFQQ